jgi:hypothetical protein
MKPAKGKTPVANMRTWKRRSAARWATPACRARASIATSM